MNGRQISPGQIVEEYIEAYNRFDLDALDRLIDDDIVLIHHNRDLSSRGRRATLERYRTTFALMPDRRFLGPRVLTQCGDRVFLEHRFRGTFAVDTDTVTRGEILELDLVTVFRVRLQKVVEYHDYG